MIKPEIITKADEGGLGIDGSIDYGSTSGGNTSTNLGSDEELSSTGNEGNSSHEPTNLEIEEIPTNDKLWNFKFEGLNGSQFKVYSSKDDKDGKQIFSYDEAYEDEYEKVVSFSTTISSSEDFLDEVKNLNSKLHKVVIYIDTDNTNPITEDLNGNVLNPNAIYKKTDEGLKKEENPYIIVRDRKPVIRSIKVTNSKLTTPNSLAMRRNKYTYLLMDEVPWIKFN